MKLKCLIFLLLLSLFNAASAASLAQASGATGPRFTWAAFQRFWDKGASPLVQLKHAEKVKDGYLIDYGHTTTLRVLVEDDRVTGVSVRFGGGKHNDAGGPQFLRLMRHAISVGTYRWPEDKIQEAYEYFEVMSPEPKTYRFQSSEFYRGFEEGLGWEFRFDYVPDLQNPGGRPPLPGDAPR